MGTTIEATPQRVYLWAGVSQVGRQGIQFLVLVVLARLLTPAQFGLAAIVLAVSLFAAIFTDLGLSTAVIQTDDLDDDFLCTVYWLNAVTGLVLAAVFALVAPFVASFYGDPALIPLLRLSGLTFALSIFAVQKSMLERELRFRSLARIEIICSVCGAAASILAALAGAGATSLVIGPLVTVGLNTVLYSAASAWRPSKRFSLAKLRVIWSYSWGLVGFNVVNYWTGNLDNLVVGRLGPAALGNYSRAFTLMMLPIQQFATAIARGLLPRLAKIKADRGAFRAVWMSAVSMSWLLGAGVCVLMLIAGHDVAFVILGPQWHGVGQILEVLAISIPPQLVSRTFGAVFQASGMTTVQFKLGAWTSLTAVGAILTGYHWGVLGVAWSVVFGRYAAVAICLPLVLRVSSATPAFFARSLFRGLIAVLIGAVPAAIIHSVLIQSAAAMRLVMTALIFLVFYCAALHVLGEPALRRHRAVLR